MKDRINKLTEKQQREFALICASRAVDRVNIPEINEYFTLICLAVEADMLEEIKSTSEYWAANRAAYWSANSAANWAAYWSADRSANSAANWAANWAANSAANSAAYWSAEREIQNKILDNMLEGK